MESLSSDRLLIFPFLSSDLYCESGDEQFCRSWKLITGIFNVGTRQLISMLSMTLNFNMLSSLANIEEKEEEEEEEEAISRTWPEYLRGFPHCLCCCFSVGNVFPESNPKGSCDFVGDNVVAGSVFDKGQLTLLKDIGSLNLIKTLRIDLRREVARMASKLLRLKKGLKVFL